jgi:regulator of sigma E protease
MAIKILQLIASLSLLVFIHELGHFLFAKLFKTRVEKFYIFLNPWFSLFKFKKGDTTYGIGWLPVGGYVKIAGMIDESMDKEQMKQPAQPWEFRSKPAYQRFLIMVGGVLFNFIFALIIFSMSLMHWGEEYLSVKDAKYGIYCDSLALSTGFQNGDIITKIGNKQVEKFSDIMLDILTESDNRVEVLRNGQLTTIRISDAIKQKMIKNGADQMFIVPFIPFIIDSVIPGSPASATILQKGDRVVAINGIETPAFYDFSKMVKTLKNKKSTVSYTRNDVRQDVELTVSKEGTIGVAVTSPDKIFHFDKIKYTFFESIPAGFNKGVSTLGDYIKQMKLVFTPEGAKQVGGFASIGSLFPVFWDWQIFWGMTAFLSIVLAFMNILPIPALDGGHIMFVIYEIVTRRKPSEKFQEKATLIGISLLLTLLLFANGNDLFRFLFK